MRPSVEIVGMVGVILSLVFVAVELRQNTVSTQAQSVLELNVAMNEIMISIAENDELAELLSRNKSEVNLSPAEALQLQQYAYASMNVFESAHVFHTKDLMDESDYDGWRDATCMFVALPAINRLWRDGHITLNLRFTEFVNTECLGLATAP